MNKLLVTSLFFFSSAFLPCVSFADGISTTASINLQAAQSRTLKTNTLACEARIKELENQVAHLQQEVDKLVMVGPNLPHDVLATKVMIHRAQIVDDDGLVLERVNTEKSIYVLPAKPTMIEFEDKIIRGLKRKNSELTMERHGKRLAVFARAELPHDGEIVIVEVENTPPIVLRFIPADDDHQADSLVYIRRY